MIRAVCFDLDGLMFNTEHVFYASAEELLGEDLAGAAIEQWPAEGIPDNPRAWLVTTGRFKGIDRMRKRRRRADRARATRAAAPRARA